MGIAGVRQHPGDRSPHGITSRKDKPVRTGTKLLRLTTISTCAALAVAFSGVGATAASATARPAAAAHAEYRLTAAEIPAAGNGNMCMYYGPGLCFNYELATLIIVLVQTGIQIWDHIPKSTESKGPDKGEIVIEIEDEGDGFSGYCLSAYALEVKLLKDCGASQSEWIEVPTGPAFALESVYYYNKSNANNNMITAHSDSSSNTPYLTHVLPGGEDLRVFYWNQNLLKASPSPSPTPAPVQSPSPSPSPTG
jgi:hypothetical protein